MKALLCGIGYGREAIPKTSKVSERNKQVKTQSI